jgi:hypothetical protein
MGREYQSSSKECNMKCLQARMKLSAYIDHELDAASARQLESHLEQCGECREELDAFHGLDALLRGLPSIDLGPEFASQMVERVREDAAHGGVEHPGRLSLFERLSQIAQDFVDLLSSRRSPSTGTLEEFSDFPPLSMGYVYFHLMDVSARG